MLKKYLAAILCVTLIFTVQLIPVSSEASTAEGNKERVYYVNEFSSPEDLGTMATNNNCTPTISVSDDGLSVLRIENTVATNGAASGFFHPNGNCTKYDYLKIEDAPVLAFEYKVNRRCRSG